MFSLSAMAFSQPSSRTTMMVQTGPMVEMSLSSFSRLRRPRSTASATAIDWGSVNEAVALMLTPRKVASSMASMPAQVMGILTIMFGASPLKYTACSRMAWGSR